MHEMLWGMFGFAEQVAAPHTLLLFFVQIAPILSRVQEPSEGCNFVSKLSSVDVHEISM